MLRNTLVTVLEFKRANNGLIVKLTNNHENRVMVNAI